MIDMTALEEEVTVDAEPVLMVEHGAQFMIGTLVQHMSGTRALSLADIAGRL